MYDKFIKIKQEKPWLFWLLIVPFIFVAIVDFYNKYLINSGKQAVKDAEKKDVKLKTKQDKAEALSEYHEQKADDIEDKIKNIETEEDWHLK